MDSEKINKPDKSLPESVSHLLSRFYYLLLAENLNIERIEETLDEISVLIGLAGGLNAEKIISKAIEATPVQVKRKTWYTDELTTMAKTTNELLAK